MVFAFNFPTNLQNHLLQYVAALFDLDLLWIWQHILNPLGKRHKRRVEAEKKRADLSEQ